MADRPRAAPEAWAADDDALRRVFVLDAAAGPPYRAAQPCPTCGGLRRYRLSQPGRGGLCRCLDCGRVTRRCAEAPPP